jgi:ribonucleoside-diphosphate reductase alpha chain
MSSIDQLRMQATIQAVWADNAVSVTIYIHPGELDDIKDYLRRNWHEMKSVSFLPYAEHGFEQAPLEEITEERYHEMKQLLVDLVDAPQGGLSELLDDDCVNGACPIR